MCGIVGYYTTRKDKVMEAKDVLTSLLLYSEERGKQATGLGYLDDDGQIQIIKDNVPARQFVISDEFVDFKESKDILPKFAIGHTRFPTYGSPNNHLNNHPVIYRNRIALVHNGTISNHDDVIQQVVGRRKAEVDTEAISAPIYQFVEEGKTAEEAITETSSLVRGSMACALIDTDSPRTLRLWRRVSPLFLACHKETGVIYFASSKEYLERSLTRFRPYHSGLFYDLESPYIIKELDDRGGVTLRGNDFDFFDINDSPIIVTGKEGGSYLIEDYDNPNIPIISPNSYYMIDLYARAKYIADKLVTGGLTEKEAGTLISEAFRIRKNVRERKQQNPQVHNKVEKIVERIKMGKLVPMPEPQTKKASRKKRRKKKR